jgi:2-methylcitrate dehydratase PrpD
MQVRNMGVTEELVDNILETRFQAFTKDIVERAKDEVIDVIGCAIGGANDTGCPAIIDLVREWSGSEESTVLAYGVRAPSQNAALANAVMARSFDYGIVDAFVEGEVRAAHFGETLVPTAIAVAEQKAMGGRELLTALILGEDLVSRILFASDVTPGWDHVGTLNTLGATAVAGKLWGLDKRQWRDAFGIALNQMAGTDQVFVERDHCFKLAQGLAAQRGIFSVRLASKGFTSVKDFLMGERGYFHLYCQGSHPEVLTRHLGQKYYTEVTFKPYPCCRGTHAAVECALEIVGKYGVEASDIDEAAVIVSTRSVPPFLRDPFPTGVVPHVSAIFSLQYIVANILLRKGISLEHFTEEAITDPRIAEMVKKVKTTTQDFPDESFFATTVSVRLKDGREFSAHVNMPRGNEIYAPLTKEEKGEKFRRNLSFSGKVSMKNGDKALSMLERLEEVDDITEIIRLLA